MKLCGLFGQSHNVVVPTRPVDLAELEGNILFLTSELQVKELKLQTSPELFEKEGLLLEEVNRVRSKALDFDALKLNLQAC